VKQYSNKKGERKTRKKLALSKRAKWEQIKGRGVTYNVEISLAAAATDKEVQIKRGL